MFNVVKTFFILESKKLNFSVDQQPIKSYRTDAKVLFVIDSIIDNKNDFYTSFNIKFIN